MIYHRNVHHRNGIAEWSHSVVKRNFWPLRNSWPIIVCQLFCFSDERNKIWRLLFWYMLC